MPRRPWFALALLLPLLPSPPASARRPRRLPTTPRIVNGVLDFDHPETGALLKGTTVGTADLQCSGTLIGCSTFLTAAHCVESDLTAGHYWVFLQHGGVVPVTSIAMHPSYSFPVADAAVLSLASPVTAITPSAINQTATPAFGTVGTIVGFGRTGSSSDYGLKRAGEIVTASCTSGISDATSVCWDFDNPIGPAGEDSNTCNGDSGGPLFLDAGGPVVAGITSGGESANCLAADHSYDTNVFAYRSWIAGTAGPDLGTTSCGALPAVGTGAAVVEGFTGTVDGLVREAFHVITVPAGTLELRIAMNAIDDGSDFDLYVRAGAPPTTETYDCQQAGSNQYGVCVIPAPTPGPWHILVHRYTGDGLYQVTTTRFGADCADPANAGSGCDDGSPCTGPDTCLRGVCSGTAVADGTPCDDGSACSSADVCDAGSCKANSGPAEDCLASITSGRTTIALRDHPDDGRDRLKWKWNAGAATSLADFGDPRATTPYTLCLYDTVAGAPHLVLEQTVPPGSGWFGLGASGYRYSDSTLAQGGVRSVRLQPGTSGQAKFSIDARGPSLGALGLPLAQDPRVTVQLVSPDRCWTSDFSAATLNDGIDYKARGD